MLGEVMCSLVIHCLGRHCKHSEDQAQLLKWTPQHSQQMHGKHRAKQSGEGGDRDVAPGDLRRSSCFLGNPAHAYT